MSGKGTRGTEEVHVHTKVKWNVIIENLVILLLI